MERLRELYYDPATGLTSADKLLQRARQKGIKVSRAAVKQFVKQQETAQVFRRRNPKHYFPLLASSPFMRIQIDLADVSNYSHANKGVRFLFLAADVFTRYLWVLPLKTKGEKGVLAAFQQVVEEIKQRIGTAPAQLDSDMEAAFLSRAFQQYLAEGKIFHNLLPLEDYKGTAVVERAVRTIRELIQHYMTAYSTRTYIDVLDLLVQNYNTRVNQGIGRAPAEAAVDPEYSQQWEKVVEKKTAKAQAAAEAGEWADFKVGDRVRVLLRKRAVFDKGTAPKWSTSVHTIERRADGLYFVTQRVSGYKAYELQRADKVEGLPRDEEEMARVAAEEAAVRAQRRMERQMRQEGIVPALEERQPRVRRQADLGPYLAR
jgi:hypothetical protein